MDRHETKLKRGFSRAGVIAAAIYNVNRQKGTRPIGPADIFPALRGESQLPREATPAEIDMMFRGIQKNFQPERRNG